MDIAEAYFCFSGAAKSNFGHLEGASGLLGVIKSVLAIEKGVIPPNTNFEKLNANIDDAFFHLKFPTQQAPWPETASGIRRASVNSFGYGGTNAHVVLDDARSYMQHRGLSGHHCVKAASSTHSHRQVCNLTNENLRENPRLLVFSAFDEQGIERQLDAHREALFRLGDSYLDDYAYTLACRRDAHVWKGFCILSSSTDVSEKPLSLSTKPCRATQIHPTLCLIFTGQGAQWHGMAQELLACSVFRDSLVRSQRHLERLGWTSSLIGILSDPNMAVLLDRAQYSQVCTTCVQIALVDVCRWLAIVPSVVVGHSSGEIAAAYCAGYLDHNSAVKVSYYRGLLSSSLEADKTDRHSMAAVGLSVDETRAEIERFEESTEIGSSGSFTISCINSPRSVTISGPIDGLSAFTDYLTTKHIFARLLRVQVGYHSPQMFKIASQYAESMGVLQPDSSLRKTTMVSSVTGAVIHQYKVCRPDYWVHNMVSTVNFLAAIQSCCKKRRGDDMKNLDGSHTEEILADVWLEIGPHSALHGPLKQIIQNNKPQGRLLYSSALVRNVSALNSLLNAIGSLWLENVDIDMCKAISLSCSSSRDLRTVLSLPAYSFNHSTMYWEESQANVDFRLREHPCHDLVGTRIGNLRSKAEAQWRFRIKTKSMPWIEDHKIQGTIVYPAAGSLAMVIEATKQLLGTAKLHSLELKDVDFSAPIHISSNYDTQIALHLSAKTPGQTADLQYRFRAFSSISDTGRETLVCSGIVRGNLSGVEEQVLQDLRSSFLDAKNKCSETIDAKQLYESMTTIGLEYGPAFQALTNISYTREGEALATSLPLPIEVSRMMSSESTVHPSRLDGVFHLGFAAMAGADDLRAMVPTRIGRLYLPVSGFGHRGERGEMVHCQIASSTERNASFSITVFDEEALELKAHVQDLELTALSGSSEERKRLDDAPSVCHQIQWKPDLATMSPDEIIAYCEVLEPANLEWVEILHSLTLSYATLALQSVSMRKNTCKSSMVAPSMENYTQWLAKQVDDHAIIDQKELGVLLEGLPSNSVTDAYIAIGRNLRELLLGAVQLNEILPPEWDVLKLIQQLEIELGAEKDSLTAYIDCLTHKHPNLHFCEIGVRFGAIASSIPDLHGDAVTARRYAGYTIADVDESLLRPTQQQLSNRQHVKFKVIDGACELGAQGFDPQSLDIIIFNLTGSDTTYTQGFIESMITLLKPDGKLIVREIPQKNFLWDFIHGLGSNTIWPDMKAPVFSGSLLSHESLPQPQILDMVPRWSAAVYQQRVSDEPETSLENPILVVDRNSTLQQSIGTELCKTMRNLDTSNILSLSEVATLSDKSCYDFVMLVDLETPLLANISREDFIVVKDLLLHSRTVIWGKRASDVPEYALNEGLLRVSRHENTRTSFVSLGLEVQGRHPASIAGRIDLILKNMRQGGSITPKEHEPEYREHNGLLCIPRVVEARGHDKHIFSSLEKPLAHQTIGEKKLRLAFATPGVLDTQEFVQDDLAKTQLASDQTEIKVQAIGVNFKDLMGLLGRASSNDLGSEFAGVVTAVGDSVKNVKPGDRVVAAYVDSYRTYARAPWQVVYRIPDDVSFEAAASIPTAFRTAYFCLFQLAHLQKGESILIHRASGGTGQAAIQLAQMVGATIYVTVGSSAKKQLLMEHYDIPEEHILHSRSTSFGGAIKRLTEGRGVDVVLNSLTGELLETSWDSVAPFGRFIEIGLGDAYTRQQLPMFNFSRGVSFMSFNLTNFMSPEYFPMHTPLMKSVWGLLTEKKIHPPHPLQVFPVAKIEDAFRLLNSGQSSGKIVIEMDRTSIVPACYLLIVRYWNYS
jgi:acyl transferase domain-containing protein/NADPH:quinone reductase-like Zn-dependent oxidoreductase